ncbi:branched-chain amino acid ABC transporter permease [Paracoccus liaowanqingii]|uniref:Branched-chain amino acid ABC transporter permease n=1 Tax=Paracoccus liaowanqingii TaxID=2560053 RepID=A0A4Z1C0K4_9RHOB|nr:branched-chain amino acid ABC transporter permease [Paracoccus liaowanqingii]TGN61858.1 branched-chain amino acid ABC transporter permease [Paracoccus liaowanqingii]
MTILMLDILTTASILFVVAAGLMIILGVMKLINFAHGAFLTVGGYVAFMAGSNGLNPWLAAPLAGVFGFLAGLAVERVVIRPLYDRPLDAILATWGLGIVIGQLITIGFGRGVQFAESPLSGTVSLLGIDYSAYRLALAAIAVGLAAGLSALLYLTRFGLNARAVIMNETLARGLGIDSTSVRAVTFGLGAGLACAAGALITPLLSVDPNMGLPWLVNSFMLVLVSGMSFPSLMVAALVLGGAQVVVSTYLSPILGGMTIVVVAALVMRINPKGFSRA